MKKQVKKQLLELVQLLAEAHEAIYENLNNKEITIAAECLAECQNTAIFIGEKIDEAEGNGTESVKLLESYCELVYETYNKAVQGIVDDSAEVYHKLQEIYSSIYYSIEHNIPEVKEIVFLPYKASMWDSLESVWKKFSEDKSADVKVVPIPYYDKNADGTFGQMHYEGDCFPESVEITHYNDYDFENNHPDEIYIHNPYDDANVVTSVHPFFYSKNIKKYTDKLVYIPYFVIDEFDLNNEISVAKRRHFAQVPAVIHADEVIVQSENMRKFYIDSMVVLAGEEKREYFENKIKGYGSPKIEKIKSMTIDDIEIPEEWNKYLYRDDGTKKKVILYNNSISTFLRKSEYMFNKMENVFEYFKTIKEEVALLWRPHPLMEATIASTNPQMLEEYKKIVEMYKKDEVGIYDDTSDMSRAIILADAYYGDPSSLVTLCKAISMPVMLQNPHVIL